MFSYFNGGIKNCTPNKKITIERLVKEIKANNTTTIQAIRSLDHTTKEYKKKKTELKAKLSYITPNCTVSYRNDENIREFSGYIYFDIDNCEDVQQDKRKLIEKYTEVLSLVCISSSGRGLCFLVKVENEITSQNFHSIRQYLCENVFKELNLDPNTSSISNAWYVSYDPYCFYNTSAVIDIPEHCIREIEEKRKSADRTINIPHSDIVPGAPYRHRFIDINEVLNVLKFRTEVEVTNRIFDVWPVECCEVRFNRKFYIPDKKKRSVFSQVIHSLLYINPDVQHDYILSYVIWLNDHKTVTTAERRDVIRWFDTVVRNIETTGEIRPRLKVKYFHCREKTIAPSVKRKLGMRLVNLYKKEEYIYLIGLAKQIIELQKSARSTINNSSTDIVPNAPKIRATQQEVWQLINERAALLRVKGIGIRTVKEYWNWEPIGIDEIIKIENERLEITYISPNIEWDTPPFYNW